MNTDRYSQIAFFVAIFGIPFGALMEIHVLSPITAGEPPNSAQVSYGAGNKSNKAIPLDIQIDSDGIDNLRRNPRLDISASVSIAGSDPISCLLHLKGTSTFRAIEELPSFTIKKKRGVLFDNYSKLHINNCVADGSLMRDYVARMVFQRLGVPTPHAGHMVVKLNGRYLGHYAWVQGINNSFLETAFADTSGLLIEGELEDWTATPRFHQTNANVSAGLATRKVSQPVTLLTPTNAFEFLLGELLVAHEDGCAFNCNNYWVYYSPEKMNGAIFPHTMDAAYRSRSMIGVGIRCKALVDYLREDGNKRRLLRAIENQANNDVFWRSLFREYDSYTSNLLTSIVWHDPNSALYHCRQMEQLRKTIESNLTLLRNACGLTKETIDESRTVRLNQWSAVRAGVILEGSRGHTIVRSSRNEKVVELTTSVVLAPGSYRLRIDWLSLLRDSNLESEIRLFWNTAGKNWEVACSAIGREAIRVFEVPALSEPKLFNCREVQFHLFLTKPNKEIVLRRQGIVAERIR